MPVSKCETGTSAFLISKRAIFRKIKAVKQLRGDVLDPIEKRATGSFFAASFSALRACSQRNGAPVAQAIAQADAEIAEKCRFETENSQVVEDTHCLCLLYVQPAKTQS